MPKYEVVKDSYLELPDPRSDSGHAPKYFKGGLGTKVNYDGWPGAGLAPIDAEAKRRCEIVAQHRLDGVKLPPTVADYDKAQAKPKARPKPQETQQATA